MKNKVITIIFLVIFMIISTININNVQADNEEDTNNLQKDNEAIQQIAEENETEMTEVQTRETTDTTATAENEDDENEVEFADFSKAQFSLRKEGISKAIIEISGVTPKEGSSYYLFITSNSNKPNVTSNVSDGRISLFYDETSKKFESSDTEKVAEYVEKNQDLYASVVERRNLQDNVVIYGKKLNRYEESKYSDAFDATFMTYDSDQIVTNFTHARVNNRKLQIKIGKITEQSILQNIKNGDGSGFSSLLSFAKSNSGIYNQTLNADSDDIYSIEYNAGDNETKGNKVIDLNSLEDGGYYYLYVKTDAEDGKYVSNEAVTLARASVYGNGNWFMFFYGSDDFEWTDFGNVSGEGNGSTIHAGGVDSTVAPSGRLPQTGVYNYVIVGVCIIGLIGVVLYRKYKKYDF